MSDGVTLYLGDCLDVIRDLPDGSIDAVVTDPPYGAGVAKWDSDIPPQAALDECLRVSKGPVLCDGMRDLEMAWRCFVRADQVDAGTLKLMGASGCAEIGLGVESGSNEVLRRIRKGETVERQADAIRWAHDAGVRVKAFLIVGLPGETPETLAETERFIQQAQPDDIDVSVLQVYPGAPLYDRPDGITVEGPSAWYKGRPGEYTCAHRTDALSAADICAARERLELAYKGVIA